MHMRGKDARTPDTTIELEPPVAQTAAHLQRDKVILLKMQLTVRRDDDLRRTFTL